MDDDCPSDFTCPITCSCMVDPVVAADGITYERDALIDWLSGNRTSPQTGLLLSHFNMHPNHERKAQIAEWTALRLLLEEHHRLLQEHFNKLTGASSSAEVVQELTLLIRFVRQVSLVVPAYQLNSLRSSLCSDKQLFTVQVREAFAQLHTCCEQVSSTLTAKAETAQAAADRADKTVHEVEQTESNLTQLLTAAEDRVAVLQSELVVVRRKACALRRVREEYVTEARSCVKSLHTPEPAHAEPPAAAAECVETEVPQGGKRKRSASEQEDTHKQPKLDPDHRLDSKSLVSQALLWVNVDPARERVLIELAAEQHHQAARARCVSRGWGGELRDEEAAFKSLILMEESAAVVFYLGECYQHGRGTTVEFTKALEYYEKGASIGLPAAQTNLGLCYREGLGVVKDTRKAIEFISKAARAGYAVALSNMGFFFQNGRGIRRDLFKGVECYKKAAVRGFAKAQTYLAMCYTDGLGVEKDPKKAAMWFEHAAEQGLAVAQNSLGQCYEYATGKEQDDDLAFLWISSAAKQGLIVAQNRLGRYYQEGIGVHRSWSKAIEWFSMAAGQNHTSAQNSLGLCYQHGKNPDMQKAFMWYAKAAQSGFAAARCNLGYCYQNGAGVAQSDEKAVEWYSKSAAQGEAEAQTYLGICYENGTGVERDPQKAVSWYLKASDQGYAVGRTNLGVCYQNGIGVEADMSKAVSYYTMAAEQGNAGAQTNLAFCFMSGNGVAKDMSRAIRLFSKAADQGNTVAKHKVMQYKQARKQQQQRVQQQQQQREKMAVGVNKRLESLTGSPLKWPVSAVRKDLMPR